MISFKTVTYKPVNTINNEFEPYMTHSKNCNPKKKPNICLKKDDGNLSESSRNKLNVIINNSKDLKDTLFGLVEKHNNKREIVKELKDIYQGVLDKVETSVIDQENSRLYQFESLKNENSKLKQHIKNIDMKFDYIIKENRELKDYIRSKTEDYENNLHEIISKLHEELKFLNENNSNTNPSTHQKQNNNNVSQKRKNIEKTSTHYKESPISNNEYSENVLQTEGTNSNRNNIILNGEDSKEYDVLNSSNHFASPKNSNDSSNHHESIKIIKDENKISRCALRIEKKSIENVEEIYKSNHNFSSNLGFTLNFNNNSFKEINSSFLKNEDQKNNAKINELNFENLERKDFNDEFMEKFDDFSPSWRNECKKLKGLNREKKY